MSNHDKAERIGAVIFCLILALVFWPWALGLLDLGWWAATSQQVTSINWSLRDADNTRAIVLILWPIGWIGAFLAFVAVTQG